MGVKEILLLGNPKLVEKSEPLEESELAFARSVGEDLKATIGAFRQKNGCGRAIAAPQIGVMKQIVYLEFDSPELFINPELTEKSPQMMELWDDCMSFPDILVKVRRHSSCKVSYRDRDWNVKSRVIEGAESELLQHEIDHLHGILAIMRAIDNSQIALRSQKGLLGDAGFANP